MKRWLICAAALVVLPLPAAAQGGGAAPPTVVVRVRSLDTLVDNVKLLVSLAGREEIAKQVEGLIKAKIGPKGLEGIDPARPLGAYGRFGKEIDDISGAILVPIADEKAFLGLLDNTGLNVAKGKDDVYTVQTGTPVEVYFRFANGYAYITALNTTALEKGKLVDPVQVLGKDGPTFAATIRLDQLPDAARQIAIAQIEQGLQEALNKKVPNETDAQKALRIAGSKEAINTLAAIIKDGSEVSVTLDLDAKAKTLSANLALKGKQGTELTTIIQNIGQRPSQFGGLRNPQSAFHGALNVALPEEMKKAFIKALEEAAQQGVAKIQDGAKRQQAEKLIAALNPTIKSGELDGFIQLLGPTGKNFAILAGIKVHEGAKLGTTIHDLIAEVLPQIPEPFRSRIQLNHTTVGTLKIHRFELPDEDEGVRKIRDLIGDTNLHVAIAPDAIWFALGKDSLALLKTAVGGKTSGPSPLFLIDVDMARLAAVLAPTDELKASAKTFFQAPQDGQVRLAVEGGASLKLSLTMRLQVVQFLSQIREVKGGN